MPHAIETPSRILPPAPLPTIRWTVEQFENLFSMGFLEQGRFELIEGEIIDAGEMALTLLVNATDSIVTVDLANGKTIVLRRAFSTNPEGMALNTNEGSVKIRFEGEAEELLA